MAEQGLQRRFAPHSSCFGCGPANPKGLRIDSIPVGDEVHASWMPEPHHEAFPGMLAGGIVGTLLDCHSNWTAAWVLMQRDHADQVPVTVTADYHVKLRRPTPMPGEVLLKAKAVETLADRVVVEATLEAGGKLCATCRGTFVAVKAGHPAYHRW